WVLSQLRSGYPRFFIHPTITAHAKEIVEKCGTPGEQAMLFPSTETAGRCLAFLAEARVVVLGRRRWASVYAVFYEDAERERARIFWQHTGEGASTRLVGVVRRLWNGWLLQEIPLSNELRETPPTPRSPERGIWESLKLSEGDSAKTHLRTDIASLTSTPTMIIDAADEFLYPSGMPAIFALHRTLLSLSPTPRKSICFGFGYTDTLKILSKWGPGYFFYGPGTSSDLDDLEPRLEEGEEFVVLWCKIPSNPLLRTPDLKRIRTMTQKYGFPVLIDDTLAMCVNVDVTQNVDVIVMSLSKAYSGKGNVMGGSIVVNPISPHHIRLHQHLTTTFHDTYHPHDALIMAHNSFYFATCVTHKNTNAAILTSLLTSSPLVEKVYYPSSDLTPYLKLGGGNGYLLSIVFHQDEVARRFFHGLDVDKGPTLWTDFTLGCFYTILGHPEELQWAAEYGVGEFLVQMSVGIKETTLLVEKVERALK
ncbi:pyridoxal phosphate-dependent transferase, partial [Trichophaea hybrida]